MDTKGPLQSELAIGSLRMSTSSSYNYLQTLVASELQINFLG